MTAPTPTARGTPSGRKMPDGYQTLYVFARIPTMGIWEKSVKPPGVDGGDAINTTTMQNLVWQTMAARALKTLTQSTFKAAYDPDTIPALVNAVNQLDTCTIHYPDDSSLAFYGFLKSVEFEDLVEGTMPEGTFTVTPTNYDPVGNVEAGPFLTAAVGT